MLQTGHWSHIQLVLVHTLKWSGCVSREMTDSSGIQHQFYGTVLWSERREISQELLSLFTEQEQIHEFIIHCSGQMKELL